MSDNSASALNIKCSFTSYIIKRKDIPGCVDTRSLSKDFTDPEECVLETRDNICVLRGIGPVYSKTPRWEGWRMLFTRGQHQILGKSTGVLVRYESRPLSGPHLRF